MRDRAHNLNVRLTAEELALAHALADDRDEPMTMLVRRLLRDAYVARFGLEKPKHAAK